MRELSMTSARNRRRNEALTTGCRTITRLKSNGWFCLRPPPCRVGVICTDDVAKRPKQLVPLVSSKPEPRLLLALTGTSHGRVSGSLLPFATRTAYYGTYYGTMVNFINLVCELPRQRGEGAGWLSPLVCGRRIRNRKFPYPTPCRHTGGAASLTVVSLSRYRIRYTLHHV